MGRRGPERRKKKKREIAYMKKRKRYINYRRNGKREKKRWDGVREGCQRKYGALKWMCGNTDPYRNPRGYDPSRRSGGHSDLVASTTSHAQSTREVPYGRAETVLRTGGHPPRRAQQQRIPTAFLQLLRSLQLAASSRVRLEKLTVSQFVKKFLVCYITRSSITVFTKVFHSTSFWATLYHIHHIPYHRTLLI